MKQETAEAFDQLITHVTNIVPDNQARVIALRKLENAKQQALAAFDPPSEPAPE